MTSNHDSCASEFSLIDWRFEIAALYHRVSETRSLYQQFFVTERKRLYDTHQQSPMREGKSISFFDYDPAFCFEVLLNPVDDIDAQTVDGGNDGLINFQAVALTSGLEKHLGKELTIYRLNQYGGGLFYRLETLNHSLSYGGGRYLIDTAKSAWLGLDENRLRLDFNFSYFPSCAHNDRFICPLSAKNRLTVSVSTR